MDFIKGKKKGAYIIGQQQRERPIFSGANLSGRPTIKGASDNSEDFYFFQTDLNISK